jgi:hypothetical protein
MRDPKGKSVKDLFPAIFEDTDEEEYEQEPLSQSDIDELQQIMREENERIHANQQE